MRNVNSANYSANEIEKRISRAIHEAPIDKMESIKAQPIVRMTEHDEITLQHIPKEKRAPIDIMLTFISVKIALESLLVWVKNTLQKPSGALAAIAMAVSMVFAVWVYEFRIVESTVFLDVNPSITITTNRRGQVLSFREAPGADLIFADVDIVGRGLTAAAIEVLGLLSDKGFLEGETPTMLLTVWNNRPDVGRIQADKLNEILRTHLNERRTRAIVLVQSIQNDEEMHELAYERGISFGKMYFVNKVASLAADLDEDTLSEMSIEEIARLAVARNLDISGFIWTDADLYKEYENKPDEDDVYENDEFEDDEYENGFDEDDEYENEPGDDDEGEIGPDDSTEDENGPDDEYENGFDEDNEDGNDTGGGYEGGNELADNDEDETGADNSNEYENEPDDSAGNESEFDDYDGDDTRVNEEDVEENDLSDRDGNHEFENDQDNTGENETELIEEDASEVLE